MGSSKSLSQTSTLTAAFQALKILILASSSSRWVVAVFASYLGGLIKSIQSGAIIEYLVQEYDRSSKLTYITSPQRYLLLSWLHFQVSGQGPYFGQAAWFLVSHHEKNSESAIERYQNEIKRVLGVIDTHLKETGGEYLVGDKCTYANLAWVP